MVEKCEKNASLGLLVAKVLRYFLTLSLSFILAFRGFEVLKKGFVVTNVKKREFEPPCCQSFNVFYQLRV